VSSSRGTPVSDRACVRCLRRSWLLAELGPLLDFNCRDGERLLALLELDDEQLIEAVAGRRRTELAAAHASFHRDRLARVEGVCGICRHDPAYPPRLRASGVVAMLHVDGGATRLHALGARPVVAFVGRGAASDYGTTLAASLARSLATSGVTVAAEPSGAIGPAALAGAGSIEASAIGVVGGGLIAGAPARARSLCRRLARVGCLVSELPCSAPRRRWSAIGCERMLASLATVVLVVEADDTTSGLCGARIAGRFERTIAAVPGRVTSRGSRGAHALLRDGARLVTCAADLLDVICEAEGREPAAREQAAPHAELEPRLRRVLERVGAGCDTPGRLLAEVDDEGELFRALGELELSGLLARGDGGRYVPSGPLGSR
jgi:DNA processing protein